MGKAAIICMGELFIDLVPHSQAGGQWLYLPSPGGAPGNVAVGLAKLGHSVLMISRTGRDAFGALLRQALEEHGVDVSGVVSAAAEKAGLSVVTLDEKGDRSFMFYHDAAAEQAMEAESLQAPWFEGAQVLHAGILPLASPISAAAQRHAMALADASGMLISCDVNFRPGLWPNTSHMLAAGREMIARASVVKVSLEELQALQGDVPVDRAVRLLWHDRLQVFSVTRGEEGAVLYTAENKYDHEGFRIAAQDTTGAGDAYAAAVISGLLQGLSPQDLLRRACAAGALAASRKGAMSSLPTQAEIDAFLRGRDLQSA